VRIKTYGAGGVENKVVGPLGADRERLLIPVGGKLVKKFTVEIVSANTTTGRRR